MKQKKEEKLIKKQKFYDSTVTVLKQSNVLHQGFYNS